MPDEYTIQRLLDRWAIVYRDEHGKRHRERLTAPDRIGAEAEARQRWRLGTRNPRTVGEIIAAYLQDRERAEVVSVERMQNAWKAMKSYWGEVSPSLIDTEMAKAYAKKRSRSAATLRYELGMLAVSLRWARTNKLIDVAPEIWRPAPPERRERHLSREQFRKYLAAVVAPHAQLYMVLGIATCARPSAILELTWPQVNFKNGLIDLNPPGRAQTKKRRPVVPLADYAREPLERAYEARISDFVIERGGKRVANIKKAFLAASQRSGIKATPYTLRHTGAVWRAEDGISMPELAQLMGHDDDHTTQKHYARFSPTHLRRAANAGTW